MAASAGSRTASCATLHLFGGPYVTIDDCRTEIPEGSKRLLTLVALRRRRVERRYAAGLLWPIGSDERAAGNLRSALWRLRGAGIELLVVDRCSLRFRDDVELDIEAISDWALRLTTDTAGPEDLALPPSWSDALDLLPGWYDDWALIERERLRQRVLHGLEALCYRFVEVGRFGEAIEIGMAVVAVEPLRESAQRALLHAHLAEGNVVEATRRLHSYRDLLRRELGVEPAPDLSAFIRRPVSAGMSLPRLRSEAAAV